MRKSSMVLTVLFTASALGIGSQTGLAGTTVETGWGPLSFNAGVQPRTLPRHQVSAVAVGVSGRISANTQEVPGLKEVTMAFDRNGVIDATGLPVCTRSQLQALTTANARRICHKSIVGTGLAHIAFSSSSSEIPIQLTLFNGGAKAGTVTMFIHAAVPMSPQTATIATTKIKKVDQGRFGLRSVTRIPPIANGSGSLRDFSFIVERHFSQGGREVSFASARCIDSHLSGKLVNFVFSTGEHFQGERFVRACTPVD
jgi:hypothetical protein